MQQDVLNIDPEKMADLFKRVKSKVDFDQEALAARTSMSNYNEYVFGETNNVHHVDLCDALDSFEDVAAFIPRNSGKSSIVSTRYPSYMLGRDRSMRIIISSHTKDLASSFGRSIESIFRDDRFKLLFGDMIPTLSTSKDLAGAKWNETEKIVKDRKDFNSLGFRVDAKDVSIFMVGVGGAVVGRRSDIIILDDIIDRNDVKTEAQIQDIKYWFNEELRGTRHPRTQTIVVGSRWSVRDIYVYIMSTMFQNGAEITGNMVEEVLEQIRRYREIEQEILVT